MIVFLKKNPFVRKVYLFIRFWIFQPPFFSRQITISVKDQVKFKIDYVFGRHKYEQLGDRHNAGFLRWVDHCRGKSIIFDVGAHVGLYTIPASQVIDKQGKVYAFEPATANCEYLQRHLGYNHCQNVVVESVLVGESLSAGVEFYEHHQADPMNAIAIRDDMTGYQRVSRPQITLDHYCQQKGIFPDVIKMDIEGGELRAFKGAKHLLHYKHPIIFLSVHPERMSLLGDSTAELKAMLREMNYEIHYPDGHKADDLQFGEYLLT
jgi:FkbM family methyltransferase